MLIELESICAIGDPHNPYIAPFGTVNKAYRIVYLYSGESFVVDIQEANKLEKILLSANTSEGVKYVHVNRSGDEEA